MAAFRDRSAEEVRDIHVVGRDGDKWADPVPVFAKHWQVDSCPVNGPGPRPTATTSPWRGSRRPTMTATPTWRSRAMPADVRQAGARDDAASLAAGVVRLERRRRVPGSSSTTGAVSGSGEPSGSRSAANRSPAAGALTSAASRHQPAGHGRCVCLGGNSRRGARRGAESRTATAAIPRLP